jgi:hypothetical protein
MVQNPLRIDTPYLLIIPSSPWPALENSAQRLYPAGGLASTEVFVRRVIAVLGQTQAHEGNKGIGSLCATDQAIETSDPFSSGASASGSQLDHR